VSFIGFQIIPMYIWVEFESKGGLILDFFSLWLKSPKYFPEYYLSNRYLDTIQDFLIAYRIQT
jgi:hypothetical protein